MPYSASVKQGESELEFVHTVSFGCMYASSQYHFEHGTPQISLSDELDPATGRKAYKEVRQLIGTRKSAKFVRVVEANKPSKEDGIEEICG